MSPETRWGRRFKLSVRAVGEPAENPAAARAPADPPRAIVVTFEDAGGQSLSRRSIPIEGGRSTFEHVVFSDGRAGAVSEATSVPIDAPRQAAAIRIEATGGAALVRAFAYSPPSEADDQAGDAPPAAPDGYRWTFTRDKSEVWFPVAPADGPELTREGRELVLKGQRRLVRE